MKILGIDEAGRGPCIGPLVITGAMIEEQRESSLTDIGVKDSKMILPNRREMLKSKVEEMVEHETIVIDPHEIDSALESTELNLNWLEAVKSIQIIIKLQPDKVILDCPSTNPEAYREYVMNGLRQAGFTKDIVIRAEHKADANYPIVGAASIIAKVTRDRIIKGLNEKYGNFGSGYPSDPRTQAFAKENYDKIPDIFRHSWASIKKLKEGRKQTSLGEY